MDLQQLKNEAYKLSVSDRLALVEAVIQSLSRELRPRQQIPEDILERMTGLAKTDDLPPDDSKVAAMLEERLVEQYLQ